MRKILGISADWKAFSFCMLAACTFWFLKALNNDYTDDIYYPIKIEYDSKKVVPLEKLPKYIRINATGYGWTLFRGSIGVGAKPVIYKPRNLPRRRYITSSDLLPVVKKQLSNISINYVSTDTLFFKFDKLTEKKIRVFVDTVGLDLSPSYKVTTSIVATPDHILFRGPLTLLRDLPDSIPVKISKSGIQENFNEKIKIPDQGFDYRIEMVNKDVRIRFGVARFEKGSIEVPLKPVNFPDNQNYEYDQKVIITYYVSEEDKNKVERSKFQAYLNYKKLDKKDSSIKPTLVKKPSFVKDYYFSPYAVKIRKKE